MSGKQRPVGMVFGDEAGRLTVRFGDIKRVAKPKTGGRPPETLRDVAIALHFEYMIGCEHKLVKTAQIDLGKMFSLKVDPGKPDKTIGNIVKKIRARVLGAFPTAIACDGLSNEHRVIAYLARHDDGTVEGYAVKWGDLKASYGRGTIVFNPDGVAGFDLDLDEHHPKLQFRTGR